MCRREAAAFNVDRGWLFAALWRMLDPSALQPLGQPTSASHKAAKDQVRIIRLLEALPSALLISRSWSSGRWQGSPLACSHLLFCVWSSLTTLLTLQRR